MNPLLRFYLILPVSYSSDTSPQCISFVFTIKTTYSAPLVFLSSVLLTSNKPVQTNLFLTNNYLVHTHKLTHNIMIVAQSMRRPQKTYSKVKS